jgi:membrane protease subunit HflC
MQPIDESLVGVGRSVGFIGGEFVGRGRKTGEVEGKAAEEGGAAKVFMTRAGLFAKLDGTTDPTGTAEQLATFLQDDLSAEFQQRFSDVCATVEEQLAQSMEEAINQSSDGVTGSSGEFDEQSGDLATTMSGALEGMLEDFADYARTRVADEVSESVYNRMQQTFRRQASQLRAEGDEQAQRIRAEAERERTELLANGNRDADVIRGEGDAQSALTYARAYGRYPEFFSLHRSLEAYRNSIGQPNDVLVIAPKGEFFKYFKQSSR